MRYRMVVYRGFQSMLWYLQFLFCKVFGRYNKEVEVMPKDAFINPLILVPHSDDEYIGPFSILKNARGNATCLYFNLFGDDYSEANMKIRNAEITSSANFWKFKLDNNYNCNSCDLVKNLYNHTYIFVPSPYDWHPEHRRVFQTFYEALCLLPVKEANVKKIFYYSVSVPHRLNEFVNYVPLSRNDVIEKWESFQRIYKSQSFMPALRYKLNLRLVPFKCGYAAQFYVPVDSNRIKSDYENTKDELLVTQLDRLIHNINNIWKIRNVINLK